MKKVKATTIKTFKVVKTVEYACHVYGANVKAVKTDAKFHMPDMYWDRTDVGITVTEVK